MLQERLYTALHLPNFAAKADGEQDRSAPDGRDCTCYFERDWVGYGYPKECHSALIGVIAFNDDGTATAYTRDEATDAFGIAWVMSVQSADAEAAEND